MRARWRIVPLLLCLLSSTPAWATTLVIDGAGDGHGVGMSQQGARGMALHGADAGAILAHYYTGTNIGTTPPRRVVRVLLDASARSLTIAGDGRAYLSRGLVVLRRRRGRVLHVRGPLSLSGDVHGRFRGRLELRVNGASMEVIDVVALEDYVRGVVAAEMPSSWPAAALAAQAIAARTYALTSDAGGGAFDVYSDTRSQVYGGIDVETPATDAAVTATAGQIVTYDGRPVITYFFDSSGGRTEDVWNAFPGSEHSPWLVGVDDPYDGGPLHRWRRTISMGEAARRLTGLFSGRLRGIEVLQRGFSPRIVQAEVLGSVASRQVSGPDLAARLGLPSAWARFSLLAGGRLQPEPDRSHPQPPAAAPPIGPSGGTLGQAP